MYVHTRTVRVRVRKNRNSYIEKKKRISACSSFLFWRTTRYKININIGVSVAFVKLCFSKFFAICDSLILVRNFQTRKRLASAVKCDSISFWCASALSGSRYLGTSWRRQAAHAHRFGHTNHCRTPSSSFYFCARRRRVSCDNTWRGVSCSFSPRSDPYALFCPRDRVCVRWRTVWPRFALAFLHISIRGVIGWYDDNFIPIPYYRACWNGL